VNSVPSPISVVLRAFLKWWWLIAVCVALGVGVGYFIRTQQVDAFQAKVTLQIGGDPRAGTTSTEGTAELVTVYSVFVRRPLVLQAVIDDLQLGITPDDLNFMMAVVTSEDAPLLEVTITDTEAGRAATIANRIARELINQSPEYSESAEEAFLRQELSLIQQQITDLRNQHDQKVAEAAALTSAFDLSQNLEERNVILDNIGQLQEIYATMSSTLNNQANRVQILEPAVPNYTPASSSATASIILAGVGGLVLSVVTIMFITFFDDRLRWEENMPDTILGVKVLGPLGLVPRNKLPLYVLSMPDTIESEVMRQVRAKIVLASGGTIPKVITVASFDSGDGKTLTASNMAAAAADSGLRTILVDGDMRKGDLHEIFRLPNVTGLSDVLSGREDIELLLSQSLLDSGYDRLTILTSGRTTTDPAALLSGPRFARVIELLSQQFDAVILDSVPTIGGPDMVFLGEVSDGVIIVVHGQRTTLSGFRRTLQTLQQSPKVNIYGVVFNRIRLQVSGTYGHGTTYYRRTPTVTPEKLSQELLQNGKRGLFNFRSNVRFDSQGERLYSVAACATRMGTSNQTVQEWLRVGYLKGEKHGRRWWIKESEISNFLSRLPRHQVQPNSNSAETYPSKANGTTPNKPEAANPSDVIRNQREALLGYVREPGRPEDDSENT
jgi:capsular exopolysaccharide synthesis family protein